MSKQYFANAQGRIVEVLSNDGQTVTYCRQGGGYVAKLSALDFAEVFQPYSPPDQLSACYVGIDGWDETFVAYGDYFRWNGWFCPRFTEAQADAVMAFSNRMNESLDPNEALILAKRGDVYVLSSPGNEYVEVKPVITDTEDGPLPLYDFSFGWCWESRGKKRVADAATQPRSVTVAAGIVTFPDGSTVDLLAIQRTLTNHFLEHGTGDLAEAADAMMKLTRYRRLQQFSEVQARECGAMLESDGIAIHSAIRLVEKWNAMAILQGNKLRYSIPFVNVS